MEYLADTVAIIRHFANCGHIGKKAKKILKETDKGKNITWISVISLAEIMYLAERKRIPLNLKELKLKLEKLDNYKILDLDFEIIEVANKIKNIELHDRLIVASAKYINVSVLTNDKIITDSKEVKIVWG